MYGPANALLIGLVSEMYKHTLSKLGKTNDNEKCNKNLRELLAYSPSLYLKSKNEVLRKIAKNPDTLKDLKDVCKIYKQLKVDDLDEK